MNTYIYVYITYKYVTQIYLIGNVMHFIWEKVILQIFQAQTTFLINVGKKYSINSKKLRIYNKRIRLFSPTPIDFPLYSLQHNRLWFSVIYSDQIWSMALIGGQILAEFLFFSYLFCFVFMFLSIDHSKLLLKDFSSRFKTQSQVYLTSIFSYLVCSALEGDF